VNGGVWDFGHVSAVCDYYAMFGLHVVFRSIVGGWRFYFFGAAHLFLIRILNSESNFITDMHTHQQKA
jgi:hypothetical protein